MKTTWGAGEYALMAEALEPVSRRVVDAAALAPGERVLDVATGTGNAALLAAARGARVIGIDYEPALLEIAVRRAVDAGLDVEWVQADVQALPLGDGEADAVLSVFGSMYAIDQPTAARELVRVCAPGGRIVLAAWTPGSTMPAMGAALADHLPPPPAHGAPPSRWGDPRALAGLLGDAGARLQRTEIHQLRLAFATVDEATTFLIRTAGHVVAQREALVAAGRWQMLHDALSAFVTARVQRHPGRQLELEFEYLLAVARSAPA